MQTTPRLIVIQNDGRPAAQCINGMSPAVECLGKGMYTCPCGYAEGLCNPNYPVPATIRVSWKLSLDCRPVVITKHGNIEYAVTSWI